MINSSSGCNLDLRIIKWCMWSVRSLQFSMLAIIVTMLGVALSDASAYGQGPVLNSISDQTQVPEPGSGHNYQNLLNETVNFSNGSVDFKISFPVPKSRGFTLPYYWSYNSAAVNPLNAVDNTPYWDAYWTQAADTTLDGWNLAGGMPSATAAVWSFTPPPNTHQTFAGCNYQSGMTFTDSSGVMHNLYISAEATSETAAGVVQTCGTQPYVPPGGDGQVVGIPDPNTAVNDLAGLNPTTGSLVVLDKDGTAYSFNGGVGLQNGNTPPTLESMIDKNGNSISFSSTGGALWTDTAGRPGPLLSGNETITASQTVSSITQGTVTNSFPTSLPTTLTVGNLSYTATWGTTPVSYTIKVQGGGSTAENIGCQAFPTSVVGSRIVLTSLTLPNGQKYTFQYNNAFGLLSQVTYPDGGWVEYTWQLSSGPSELSSFGGEQEVIAGNGTTENNGSITYQPVNSACNWEYQTPVLETRTVSFDGTSTAQTQSFVFNTAFPALTGGTANPWTSRTATVTTTDNKVGVSSQTVYTYLPYYVPNQPNTGGAVANQTPMESTIAYYDWGQSTPSKTVQKTWYAVNYMSPVIGSESTTINKTGETSGTIYYYGFPSGSASLDFFEYLLEKDDYDYGAGPIPVPATTNPPFTPPSSSRTPTKKTFYNYTCCELLQLGQPYGKTTNQTPITVPPLLAGVVVESVSPNGTATIQAATQYAYDSYSGGQLAPLSIAPASHASSYSTTMTSRGNPTSVTRCTTLPTSPTGSCSVGPTTTYNYDITGQLGSMTDANGNTTTYSFADSFTDDKSAPSTNAYLTQIKYPPAGGGTLSRSFEYSYWLGYLTQSTDENGETTTYAYSDPLDRLTQIKYPDNGEETISYGDTAPRPTVTTSKLLNLSTNLWETSIATTDGMGHVVETQLTTDPGGTDTVLTTYNGEGKVYTVSNPFRGSSLIAGTTTTNYYDVFGRPIETVEQDGSKRQWCYDDFASSPAVANCSGPLATTPVATGTWVDSTDENGNHWQHTSDVFGRLTDVVEPNGASQSPSMETQYAYDALNDLLTVKQCGASCSSPAPNGPINRSFTYNSLAQLVMGTNPETGMVSYGYDLNGNVRTKTDGRGDVVSSTYDALNRKTSEVSTTQPTYTHSFIYDQTSAVGVTFINPLGNLTAETTWYNGSPIVVGGTTLYWNHDARGRVLGTMTCTPASCNSTNIADSTWYNLNNTYDLAGNVTSYTDGFGTTISSTYDGAGRLSMVTSSGNGTTPTGTLWMANSYSAVGLTQATLGNGAIDSLTYTNRLWLQSSSTVNPTSGQTIYSEGLTYYPNGNLQSATDSVNGNWTYINDTLNRLSTAVSSNTGQGCQFSYDAFGNRTQEAPYQGSCFMESATFSTPTNHIDGYCYDAAGNLLDPYACPASGIKNQYYYDGFGNLLSPNFNSASVNSYAVDALGHRIGKWSAGSLANQYLYGSDGNVVAEMDGSGNWLQTNVHARGQLLAQFLPTGISFLHADHLGTIRAESNSGGTRTETCSNLPFGDALNCNGNTDPFGYHFTGKEHDTESGNDYFKYRYLASSMGRWLSPDPSGLDHVDLGNPQELNLYSYVGNRPLTFVDPEGLCWKGFQWACDIIQRVENRFSGYGFQTDDQLLKNPNKRSQNKIEENRRKESQPAPSLPKPGTPGYIDVQLDPNAPPPPRLSFRATPAPKRPEPPGIYECLTVPGDAMDSYREQMAAYNAATEGSSSQSDEGFSNEQFVGSPGALVSINPGKGWSEMGDESANAKGNAAALAAQAFVSGGGCLLSR